MEKNLFFGKKKTLGNDTKFLSFKRDIHNGKNEKCPESYFYEFSSV